MAYAHKGGFRISILDSDGAVIRYLTKSTGFIGANNPLAEHRSLVLPPELKCEVCILRLERQGLEWGSDYRFHSCADVNIVGRPDARAVRADCPTRDPATGACVCEAAFTGQRCEEKDDCASDSDCGPGGSCRLVSSARFPGKACFCTGGAFGRRCEKAWDAGAPDACFNGAFPEGTRGRELRHGLFEPACYHRREAGPGDAVYWRLLGNGTSVEFVLEFRGRSWLGLGWRPQGTPNSCKAFPLPSEPAPPAKGGFHNSWTPPGPIHPMDCADMVVGSAVGLSYRIGDYYTRDRSTPLLDEDYGGNDSLTAAFGVQLNSSTVLMFRKPLQAFEMPDQPLGPGPVQLIWAKGQAADNFYPQRELKYHGSRNRGVFTNVHIVSSAVILRPTTVVLLCHLLTAL